MLQVGVGSALYGGEGVRFFFVWGDVIFFRPDLDVSVGASRAVRPPPCTTVAWGQRPRTPTIPVIIASAPSGLGRVLAGWVLSAGFFSWIQRRQLPPKR